MTETEKILDGLDRCVENQRACIGCPWNPTPRMAWPYGCIKGEGEIRGAIREALKGGDAG